MGNKTASPHLLIVEARFYDDMSDALLDGAKHALEEVGATFDLITVPGALEIPPAIAMALDAMDDEGTHYDGFIALGMVIRGETYHFDIVANDGYVAHFAARASFVFPVEMQMRAGVVS